MEALPFSELIRMVRRLGGLTQAEVAAEADIAQPQLNAIEKMQRVASRKMQRRILVAVFNLALTIRLSEGGSARGNNMTPERFSMLNRLHDLTDDEERAEEFMSSNEVGDIELKKDIAYLVWQSEVEQKQRRTTRQ